MASESLIYLLAGSTLIFAVLWWVDYLNFTATIDYIKSRGMYCDWDKFRKKK